MDIGRPIVEIQRLTDEALPTGLGIFPEVGATLGRLTERRLGCVGEVDAAE